jgi:hypothetical protein
LLAEERGHRGAEKGLKIDAAAGGKRQELRKNGFLTKRT